MEYYVESKSIYGIIGSTRFLMADGESSIQAKDLNIDDIIKSVNIKSSNPLEFEICESMITEILSLEPVELIELVSNDCTIICSHNQQILMNRIDHIMPISVRVNDVCDKTTIYTFNINEDNIKPAIVSKKADIDIKGRVYKIKTNNNYKFIVSNNAFNKSSNYIIL